MADYILSFLSQRFEPLGVLRKNSMRQEFLSAEWGRYAGAVGRLRVTFTDDAFSWDLLQPDTIVLPFRSVQPGIFKLDMESAFLVHTRQRIFAAGQKAISLECACGNDLLRRRIVDAASGTAQASKSGAAGDVMKAIVREQMGSSAGARDLAPYFATQANAGHGASVSKAFAWRNVLPVLQELAFASVQSGTYCTFDTVYDAANNRFEFRTYAGQRGIDRRGGTPLDLVLDPDRGTIDDVSVTESWDREVNYVRAGSKGEGTARVVVNFSDIARRDRAPLARREAFVDARNTNTFDELYGEAISAVYAGRPTQVTVGRVQETPGTIYGLDWGYGDYVRVQVEGRVQATRLEGVSVHISESGVEAVKAAVRV